MEAMGLAATRVVAVPKQEAGPVQTLLHPMAEIIARDHLQNLHHVIQILVESESQVLEGMQHRLIAVGGEDALTME